MPLFRVHVEKFMPSAAEYWTNVYHHVGDNLASALTFGTAVAAAERAILSPLVMITKVRADDAVPLTEQYATTVLNQLGQRDPQGAQLLPLFVVARVDFSAAFGGRPSRKYLRGVLLEADADFTNILTSSLGLINTYAAAVVAAGAWDVDQQELMSGVAHPQPGMRQLRRGSKKKPVPSSGGTTV